MTLLVTGFGPFLDVAVNPAAMIAERLHGVRVAAAGADMTIVGQVLPVEFLGAAEVLTAAFALHRPRATLLLGVARGPDYRLESGAHPVVTSEHPDATGQSHRGRQLGSRPRLTSRPVSALVAELGAHGFETIASSDCGGYVCNSTYYAALRAVPDALFLHIPPAIDAAALEYGCALVRALIQLLCGAPLGGLSGISRHD